MHYPDYCDDDLMFIFNNVPEEDAEDVRDRLSELAPFLLLNRFLAMDFKKMPDVHRTFAHLGPLIRKLTLRDHGPSRGVKFNSRVGSEAGALIVEYCRNGTFQHNKDVTVGFSQYDNERAKIFVLAKYLTNLKTLDCYKVRDKWGSFAVQQITQHCPKLERLVVVANYIDCEDFNIGRIIPHHSTLKKIKINLQSYNHSGIEAIMSKLGWVIKERIPNLTAIEMEIEIDAYNEGWDLEQEEEFLSGFNENAAMYCHFKELKTLKRCVFSYSLLYEGVATLEVKLK